MINATSKTHTLTRRALRASARLALLAALLFSAAHAARAQDEDDGPPPLGRPQQEAEGPPNGRRPPPNLFALLNLTPEQVGRIREIRETTEPEGRAIARRVNEARRTLNEAIYADVADETLVRARAAELADAQAAATRLRAQVEWRIRNVLTAEQLGKLRELRRLAQRQRRLERLDDPPPPRGRRPNADALDAPPPNRPLQRLRRRGVIP